MRTRLLFIMLLFTAVSCNTTHLKHPVEEYYVFSFSEGGRNRTDDLGHIAFSEVDYFEKFFTDYFNSNKEVDEIKVKCKSYGDNYSLSYKNDVSSSDDEENIAFDIYFNKEERKIYYWNSNPNDPYDGMGAFYSFVKNADYISIPNTVRVINKYIYDGSELLGITFTESLIEIADGAFASVNFLESIILPSSLQTIGDHAFAWCRSLAYISIPENSSLGNIGDYAFIGCVSLKGNTPDEDVLKLPNIIIIGDSAFQGCVSLEEVVLPSSLKEIGYSSFNNCTSLKSIGKLDVESISSTAFSGCESLSSISFTGRLSNIGSNAFYGCKSLKNIELPSSVVIEKEAFVGCDSLINVDFFGSNYDTSKTYRIDNKAFHNCQSLKTFHFENSYITEIGEYAFDGCEVLTDVQFPNTLTVIEKCAFSKCRSITTIRLPASVHRCGDYAFEDCDSLKVFYIEANNQYVRMGYGVFSGCYLLEYAPPTDQTIFVKKYDGNWGT